ncbi:glutaredoxin domain-containing protein [Caballeronia sp. LZ065]|uniref:glutaredoxin domain-containing protein n=1 Tax=Caballeronia sp. LZ065 TaxID=3038571 RepID=UPI0028622386|nr:glutaredoxin domain-containing protein [Caballeronia sp. LZ065]MDR5781399.1 glutaredoxin domain-containing protein [Caballeronia sp. LZ065]
MHIQETAAQPLRVFWAPGCSSCLRTKEFLTRHGIAFESVNVAAQAGAMEELRSLGARSVPVLAIGTRYVYCQSLADIKTFLELDIPDDTRLTPAVLVERVNLTIMKALGFVRQLPDDVLDGPFRNSWAPPRGLAHHVFRVVEAYLEAVEEQRELTYEMTMRGTHEVVPGQDVLTYGEAVLARFNRWWQRHRDDDFSVMQPTYWGEQSLHEVLERTTWHAMQHARQLTVVIEAQGHAVRDPFMPADLAGLPLPEKAWDDDK